MPFQSPGCCTQLISRGRYQAEPIWCRRLQVLELAQGNDKFKAIDRAIGKQGFKVVTLLRLSPLLPLALSNYL